MFGTNFTKEGKGISKDAPQKTGLALFIDIIGREFWTLVSANLLFVICSIPIVTIGASYAGLNSVIIKMLRDKPVDLLLDFKKGFFQNFKQGTIAGFIFALIVLTLLVAYNFYSIISKPLMYFIIFIAGLFISIHNYVFPLIVSIELPIKYIYKNSFYLSVLGSKRTLVALFCSLALFGFSFLLFPLSIIYILPIGVSFACFINSFFIYSIIKDYAEESSENIIKSIEVE